jgi:ferrochelatase
MADANRTGVLLVALGTPDAPTTSAVRRYLREFLWDPRVVQVPRPIWWLILNLFILPVRFHTERQAQLLRGYLGERMKAQVPVVAAMRYGNPSIAQGLAELKQRRCDRILVIPMYPQYAASTTASAEDGLKRALRQWKPTPATRVVQDFHDHRAYVKAIAKSVNDYWMKHGRPDKLVMSFHGLPKVVVERGDPYQSQCLETGRLIATELGWNDARTLITFQSRFGAQEWLQPYTDATLAALGREKTARVDVICPGFAADCLETLEEIAIEGKETFKAAGGKDFHYIPTTNDLPPWMTALSIIAMENLQAWPEKPPQEAP